MMLADLAVVVAVWFLMGNQRQAIDEVAVSTMVLADATVECRRCSRLF